MNEIKLIGGARIGIVNITIPLASLTVSKDKLVLKASLLGDFIFEPKDVISIEVYNQIPHIGQGIRINHRIAKYKKKIIFWSFKNPTELINLIKESGFLDNIDTKISLNEQIMLEKQKQNKFPIKKIVFFIMLSIAGLILLRFVVLFILSYLFS